jgi:hypothetical protein
MIKKRFNRRAQEDEGLTLIGLMLLALIIFAVGYITIKYSGVVISFISDQIKSGVHKYVNADSLYTQASEASFERLNTELATLLKSQKKTDHIIIPYTLGQYRLVGFNKQASNGDCLGDVENVMPGKCKNSGCLCLCYKEERCECDVYPEIDYFITTEDQFMNLGGNLSSVTDPITGKGVECLEILGSKNENNELKAYEPYYNWWRSNKVYLEKIEKNGKRYLFFSRYQDIQYTERGLAECSELDLKTENCVNVLFCKDYQTVDLGCDWTYSCQNNVCPYVVETCDVVENPYSGGVGGKYCLESEAALDAMCTAGPENESVPSSGDAGDLAWIESRGLCFRCAGLGQDGADSWGWEQDSVLNNESCVTPTATS